MAKRRTGGRRVLQKGQRADTQGRPGGAGIGASVVPELLVGAVNGVEVLANGVLTLARNALLTVVSGAAELGTLVVSGSAGAARGIVRTTSELVGEAVGVATNTVRTTVTTAKNVGGEIGPAIRQGSRKITSSQTRSGTEVPAAAVAKASPHRPRKARGRDRETESAAA